MSFWEGTLPETNSSHLKIGAPWKRRFRAWKPPIFRCKNVSFRECALGKKIISSPHLGTFLLLNMAYATKSWCQDLRCIFWRQKILVEKIWKIGIWMFGWFVFPYKFPHHLGTLINKQYIYIYMSVSINCVYKIYDHMHVAFPRIIPRIITPESYPRIIPRIIPMVLKPCFEACGILLWHWQVMMIFVLWL